ncbi:bifunctional phosphoribosylaminoimidazolecarboxamide formyltransferase/IMP cyclohydrolase [Patescibacteria group bacterium]|nr:MAG: bifunctional phosphoribosylaminoimidazolecarboxamide formyltransferase/IMP cyclohydrolase [Patescibacteria group bacterium]
MHTEVVRINRALISVSNKTGIAEFARELQKLGVEIISTGGTHKLLCENKIPAVEISQYTGFPEMMDGRVKTLHPLVHGGILGLRDKHAEAAAGHNIKWIDLVVCNLYPFLETIKKPGVTEEEAIENIDIGGPTMIRSAAKNIGWTCAVVDPEDYSKILAEIREKNGVSFDTRKALSAKAYAHTTRYDAVISNYFKPEKFPKELSLGFAKYYDLRYGENPHQQAAAYKDELCATANIFLAKILQGKQLSYNNFIDADAALQMVKEFEPPACVIVKHNNPCGAAIAENAEAAFAKAFACDSLSAFGGVVALNRECDAALAEKLSKIFLEIVLAPKFAPAAVEILSKKQNLRLLELEKISVPASRLTYKLIEGGLLAQDSNTKEITEADLKVVTKRRPETGEIQAMLFAWKILKHMKSNAILIAKADATVGIGVGQVSRVDSVDIAIKKSGMAGSIVPDLVGAVEPFAGCVLASDAFFPFRDSIDKIAAAAGVKAIVQPGGSIKDQEVIAACDEHGIAMVFTGHRCFAH